MSTTIRTGEKNFTLVVAAADLIRRTIASTKEHVVAFFSTINELTTTDKAAESELRKLYRMSAGRE